MTIQSFGFFVDSFRMAVSSLWSSKMRSLLTTLGIVIGITTVIAIISVIEGLNTAFARELADIGDSNVLYIQKWHWASDDWEITRKWKKIGFKELEAVREGSTLCDLVTPLVRTSRTVKYERNKLDDTLITGVGKNYQDMRQIHLGVGRFLSNVDVTKNRDVAIVGWEVAEKLFEHDFPVGKRINVGGKSLRVVGVMEKRGDFFDMNLDRTVIMPIGSFLEKFGRYRSLSIMAQPNDKSRVNEAIDELRAILRRVRKVPFGKSDNFAINQVDALKELYDKLTQGLYGAMFGVAAISLLVGGIGIMNIMLVSVTERTREIGIRKAVGARRGDILFQFLTEAIILACIGGVIGILLGFGAAILVDAISPVPAQVKWWSVLLGLGFSATVGVIFGLYPAWRAAIKNPIDCLSYE
jgi:putative ABC transport system permease protein